MDALVTALFYVYVILLGLLDAGGFYYTYRITKITGAFRGWILLLTFVVIFALEGALTFGASAALAIFSPSRIDTFLASANLRDVLITDIYNLVLAGLLFSSMFELYRTFNRVNSKSQEMQ